MSPENSGFNGNAASFGPQFAKNIQKVGSLGLDFLTPSTLCVE
jgi:hypothetical protein